MQVIFVNDITNKIYSNKYIDYYYYLHNNNNNNNNNNNIL